MRRPALMQLLLAAVCLLALPLGLRAAARLHLVGLADRQLVRLRRGETGCIVAREFGSRHGVRLLCGDHAGCAGKAELT